MTLITWVSTKAGEEGEDLVFFPQRDFIVNKLIIYQSYGDVKCEVGVQRGWFWNRGKSLHRDDP